MRKFLRIFYFVTVCLLFVLPRTVSAQSDDPFRYALPTPVPRFPKPGDKPLLSQTKNGITVGVIGLKRSVEKRNGKYGKEVDKQGI